MKNRRIAVLKIIGSLAIATTLLLFVLLKPEVANKSVMVGLVFVLIAELVFFGGFIGLEHTRGALARIGGGTTVALYSIICLITSLVYMGRNIEAVKDYLAFQLVLLFIAISAVLVFVVTGRTVAEKDAVMQSTLTEISALRRRLSLWKDHPEYGKEIRRLEEELRYLDSSSGGKIDDQMEALISDIERELSVGKDDEKVSEYLSELSVLIKKRKHRTQDQKAGGM